MFGRGRSGSGPSRGVPWTREAYRFAAVANSIMAVFALWIAWHVPFPERIEFDITGLLFLLMSVPAIGAWVAFLALALCAAYCWTRMMSASPRRHDPWS